MKEQRQYLTSTYDRSYTIRAREREVFVGIRNSCSSSREDLRARMNEDRHNAPFILSERMGHDGRQLVTAISANGSYISPERVDPFEQHAEAEAISRAADALALRLNLSTRQGEDCDE